MSSENFNDPIVAPTAAGTSAVLCGWAIWGAVIAALSIWAAAEVVWPAFAPKPRFAEFVTPAELSPGLGDAGDAARHVRP